jgi:hypothetical protein
MNECWETYKNADLNATGSVYLQVQYNNECASSRYKRKNVDVECKRLS